MARPGRGADQFPLRLPDGLRDRIKEAAESKGRSMNAEIVRVLLDAFPEPFPLQDRVKDLLDLFSALRKVGGYEHAIDGLTERVLEATEAVAAGRVPSIDEETQKAIRQMLIIRHLDQIGTARGIADQIDAPDEDNP